MPFDGIILSCIKKELNTKLIQGRVDRIYQPGKKDITITIRQPGENFRLYISAHPRMARTHLTSESKKNPITPPAFCMLLRKYWEGGRILDIQQDNLERILSINVQNIDEFGLIATTELICEFMGKHSNIILVRNDDGFKKILGSVIHIYPEVNRVRTILPGEKYIEPPPQEKFLPLYFNQSQALFKERFYELADMPINKALVSLIQGVGPLTVEELALRAQIDPNNPAGNLPSEAFSRLWQILLDFKDTIYKEDFTPSLLQDSQGNDLDFSALLLAEKEKEGFLVKTYTSPSELLDHFYYKLEKKQQAKEIKNLLFQKTNQELSRGKKKYNKIKEELKKADKAENHKMKGEVLNAYLFKVKKGVDSVELPNFYDPEGKDIKITLDPSLDPAGNAQKYFKKYKKALTAQKELSKRFKSTEEEISYLESILLSLENADLSTLEDIKEELKQVGYVKDEKGSKQHKKREPEPLIFISADGIPIYVGKNNRQNEFLTLKKAGKDDLWFHVKDMPGSHVVVPYASPPDKTIQEAALLAAYYSKGKNSANVPVDFTRIKNVRKPKGAKPGMVIYDSNKTLYITPQKNKLPLPKTLE